MRYNPTARHFSTLRTSSFLALSFAMLSFASDAGEAQPNERPLNCEIISVDAQEHTITIQVPMSHVYTPVGVRFVLAGPLDMDYAHVVAEYPTRFISSKKGTRVRVAFSRGKGGQIVRWVSGLKLARIDVREGGSPPAART
jgi:hypothetical protein